MQTTDVLFTDAPSLLELRLQLSCYAVDSERDLLRTGILPSVAALVRSSILRIDLVNLLDTLPSCLLVALCGDWSLAHMSAQTGYPTTWSRSIITPVTDPAPKPSYNKRSRAGGLARS